MGDGERNDGTAEQRNDGTTERRNDGTTEQPALADILRRAERQRRRR
jgi:hypothetical protein